jgi:predicted CXXCH cytochrome family protein
VRSKRPDITTIAQPTPIRRRQTMVTFVVVTAAMLWMLFHVVARDQMIFNPGHITMIHQHFEKECWRCHDGGPNGIISQKVSDTACITCHKSDAAIHHPNAMHQCPVKNDPADIAAAFPIGMRSSECITCHTEHRGMNALINKEDPACTRCHDNIKEHAVDKDKIECTNSVVAFVKSQHPDFGLDHKNGGTRKDPTVLKFDHGTHLKHVPGIDDLPANQQCILCHKTSETDKRYMLPITYKDNCEKCHELTLQAGNLTATISHKQLVDVRKQIDTLPALYVAAVSDLAPVDRLKLLYTGPALKRTQKPETYLPKHLIDKPDDFDTVTDYVQKQLDALSDKLTALGTGTPRYPDKLKRVTDLLGDTPARFSVPGPAGVTFNLPNKDLIEQYMAYEANDNCIECHRLSGEETAVFNADTKASATMPSTGPAVTLLAADPTMMPAVFYPESKFDHEKHKEETCISCHTAANADVALDCHIDINADLKANHAEQWDKKELEETTRLLTPTSIAECTSCHNATATSAGTGVRPASSECIECHDYHDRRYEIPALSLKPAVASSSPP